MTTDSGFSDCLSEESLQLRCQLKGVKGSQLTETIKHLFTGGDSRKKMRTLSLQQRGGVKYYHCTVWIRRSVPNEKTSCGA